MILTLISAGYSEIPTYKHKFIRLLSTDIVALLDSTHQNLDQSVLTWLVEKKGLKRSLSKHHSDAAEASQAGELGRKSGVI